MNDLKQENIDDFIKKSPSESLIIFIANYRFSRFNKELSLKCMEELSLRRSLGDNLNFEDLIDETVTLLKSIGSGFVVKISDNITLEEALLNIKKITPALIFNKDKRLIHVGKIEKEKIEKICALEEADAFEKDRDYL